MLRVTLYLIHNLYQNQQNHGVLATVRNQPVLCIPMLKDPYLHATFQVILDDKLKPGIHNNQSALANRLRGQNIFIHLFHLIFSLLRSRSACDVRPASCEPPSSEKIILKKKKPCVVRKYC